MTYQTFICFDYGEKRIGMAVGQAVTRTATPLVIIPVHNGTPEWGRISEVLDQWRPDALLVGHPLHMDGTRQTLTSLAERFSRSLAGRYQLPVFLADERLSTAEAKTRTGSGSRDAVDAIAAQVILEGWLLDPSYTGVETATRQAVTDRE